MRNIIHGNTYNNHQLSRTNKNNQGFYGEILEGIESLLSKTTQQHGSVFFTTFVLRFPSNSASSYPNDNSLLSKFIAAFTLHCKRRKFDPNYLWVRESSTTGQFHYHLLLLLNSNYIQNAHAGLLAKATELWRRCLNIEDGRGLVHLCNSGKYNQYGGIKIRKNAPGFPQVYEECFQRASYLAKCYSKGQAPANVHEFRSSQLS